MKTCANITATIRLMAAVPAGHRGTDRRCAFGLMSAAYQWPVLNSGKMEASRVT